MTPMLVLLDRDLRLALRRPTDSVVAVAFFIIATALFPFGVGAEPAVLARIAAGIIWVTALLATLLSLERLFLSDYEDGGLDQLALSPLSLGWTVAVKALAHWLVVGVPLLVASPLLALLLGLEAHSRQNNAYDSVSRERGAAFSGWPRTSGSSQHVARN